MLSGALMQHLPHQRRELMLQLERHGYDTGPRSESQVKRLAHQYGYDKSILWKMWKRWLAMRELKDYFADYMADLAELADPLPALPPRKRRQCVTFGGRLVYQASPGPHQRAPQAPRGAPPQT
jgi:hypothetical protein